MRVNWRKFERILLDHPYFDRLGTVLSNAEASFIMQGINIDAKAFMQGVYADLEAGSDPLDLESSIDRIAAQFQRKAHKRQHASAHVVIRRIAIAFMLIAAITVFLTLTKPGVALANTIYQAIVEIVDGVFRAKQQGLYVPTIDLDKLPISFDTVKEAEKALEVSIAHFDDKDVSLSSINVVNAEDAAIVVRSRYVYGGDIPILVEQTYGVDGSLSGTATSATTSTIDEYNLSDDIACFIGTMDDGTLYARILRENCEIIILEDKLSKEDFLLLLNLLIV